MDFMGIGPTELAVTLVISLLVLGPEKMVDAARTLGRLWRSLQRNVREITDTLTLNEDARPSLPPRRAPQDPVPPPEGAEPQRQEGTGQGPPSSPDLTA